MTQILLLTESEVFGPAAASEKALFFLSLFFAFYKRSK